ncbi:MAG: hypothetical protein KF716_10620 [Anaerolineae bacterium]|nr:hypothetical protein [Anaerolineae bacterium]
MLPFLAFPRHFTETPIAREGLRFLRQQMPARLHWWHMIEALLIVVCLVTAIVPAFIPIFTVRRMLAIYLPTVLLSWLVIARTILCGAALSSREQALGMWDDLVLTRMDAQQIILGKWWATVRYCWWSHAWMIVLRFITAYNLMFFFVFVPGAGWLGATPGNICPAGMNAFCHGINPTHVNVFYYIYAQPIFFLGLIGIGVLIMSAVLELVLSAAIGIGGAMLSSSTNRAWAPVILRSLIGTLAVAVMVIGSLFYDATFKGMDNGRWVDTAINLSQDRRIDLLETLQTAVSPLADHGILMTTNFLRPSGYSNTSAFQVRQAVSVILNWLLFALIILIVMRVTIDAAVQRHASPGTIGAKNG